MTRRLVVHLGPMKTGTSAFAAHLSRHVTAGTLPPHIIYPTDPLWFPAKGSIVKHHDLVELAPARVLEEGVGNRKTDATPALIAEKFAAIVAEADSRGGDVVVVMVCEIGDQRATPALATALAPYFDTIDFVLVARDQSSAVRSLLGQQIRMWNRTDVVSLDALAFVEKHARLGSYDYAKLWEKWATKAKGYTMHFVPYRNGSGTDDVSQDIFDAIGIGAFPYNEGLLNGERVHSTFTEKYMRRLALVKRWAKKFGTVPGVTPLGKYLFDALVKAAHRDIKAYRGDKYPTWNLSAADRAVVASAYRASNETFRTQLGRAATEPRWAEWFAKTLGND